jgi:hypothetical protein
MIPGTIFPPWLFTSQLYGFVRLPSYEASARKVLTEADELALEQTLLANPEAGATIAGAGGVRKIRIGREAHGRGKRGGARVIYYLRSSLGRIYLLFTYAKGESDDLTTAGKAEIAAWVKQLAQEA